MFTKAGKTQISHNQWIEESSVAIADIVFDGTQRYGCGSQDSPRLVLTPHPLHSSDGPHPRSRFLSGKGIHFAQMSRDRPENRKMKWSMC
jgi:hypothetical protein